MQMLNILEQYAHNTVGELDSYGELRQLCSQDSVAYDLFKTIEGAILSVIKRCQDSSKQNSLTNQDALFLMVQLQTLEESTTMLASYKPADSNLQAMAAKVGNWLTNTFFPKIKVIGSKLMSILSSMTTPKEWTIKGKTSALGLGNLELEIKFGP